MTLDILKKLRAVRKWAVMCFEIWKRMLSAESGMHLKYRPKYGKIVEAMLYLAHLRPGLDIYHVVKILYLSDSEHINKYGRPITQEQYFALHFGPVASTAMDLMKQNERTMERVGLRELPFELDKSGEHVRLGAPRRDVDFDMFSRTDLAILSEMVAKYADYNFDQLYTLTHDHPAWKLAWNRRGNANRAEMFYDEMIVSNDKRQALVENLNGVSHHL